MLETKGQTRKKKKKVLSDTNGDNILMKVNYNDSLLLRKYFRLDESLKDHYAQWSEKDPHFRKAAEKFQGVRILDQDPVENVFSFICSSNNNISR